MMKKKLIIAGVVVLVVALIAAGYSAYYNREIPIITMPYTVALFEYDSYSYDVEGKITGAASTFPFVENQVEIHSVYFIGGDIAATTSFEDNLAARLDPETLVTLFAQRSSKRWDYRNERPGLTANMQWEINLQQNHKPIHIVLGVNDYWYESADQGFYLIEDGDAIERALAGMLGL